LIDLKATLDAGVHKKSNSSFRDIRCRWTMNALLGQGDFHFSGNPTFAVH
jgi:hypothetical protein